MSARPMYGGATWLFLRLLGLVYLFAFWSLATQIRGLIGEDGILPARLYMEGARAYVAAQHIGIDRFRLLPTLCWISSGDAFLQALCYAGVALSVLLIAGVAPIAALPLLWLAYLSLSVVARDFLLFQWDALLLEAGLLSILLAPVVWLDRWSTRRDPPRIAVWLMLWLLFRLMLGSGLVKLASGDPTWRSLTALTYHYQTQPIPTPLAWYAYQLPVWWHKASTFATFAIELAAPFCIFGSRRWRIAAAASFVALQAMIAATGNYAFFNLLSASLCVFLVDEGPAARPHASEIVGRVRRTIAIAAAVVIVPVSALVFTGSVGLALPPLELVEPIARAVAPFRSINSYGLFAVMTTTRPEIVVEGSDDGSTWLPYEFRYKPGDLRRRPPWVAPHQPRLDWQMWFAALGRYDDTPWFQNFCLRLLAASPAVLRLMARDPFNGRPPRFVRATLYRYHFSTPAGHRNGVWWNREQLGEYAPPLSLDRQPGP